MAEIGVPDLIENEAREREQAAEVAVGVGSADLILESGRIVDVYAGRVRRADVAVAGDRIAAVGDVQDTAGEDTQVLDCGGLFILPGFVEPHFHIGSSALTIERLAEILVARGTIAMSTCFYEPAIIRGLQAVKEMIDRSVGSGLDVLLSPFGGALGQGPLGASRMTLDELIGLVQDPRCVEIREWSYPNSKFPGMRDLWVDALRRNLVIGGHLEGLTGALLQGSAALGCCSDHEVATAAEAAEKVSAGITVQIREGSGARDLVNVLPAITELGLDPGSFAFSTDEQELDSLVENGHIDYKMRMAVREGLGPIDAVRMATLGAARSLGVERNYGAVAPGRVASLAIVDDLGDFRVAKVLARGELAAEDGDYLLAKSRKGYPKSFFGTVRLDRELKPEDFLITASSGAMRVIGATPGSLLTEELEEDAMLEAGRLPSGTGLAKIAVADRHEASGRLGIALIRGLDISGGAVATTINPGMSNLMVVGDDEEAMSTAANRVVELDGGIVVSKDGEVTAELALPILGILSHEPAGEVADAAIEIARALRDDLNCPHGGILTNAGFVCLASVIPALKICDHGLIRVDRMKPPEPIGIEVT